MNKNKQLIEVKVFWQGDVQQIFYIDSGKKFQLDDIRSPIIDASDGCQKLIFYNDSSGLVKIDGIKRTFFELIELNLAKSLDNNTFEIDITFAEYCQFEADNFIVDVRHTKKDKKIPYEVKRDYAMIGSGIGAFIGISAAILSMHVATIDSSNLLSQVSDEDRMSELRSFLQYQQEHQPREEQQRQIVQEEGGSTGARHAGSEGQMGNRRASVRNARYAIRNNTEMPHLSRQAARDALTNRGIFAAFNEANRGDAANLSGVVSPFGEMNESGLDNQNANGNMNGDFIGDSFGYGGLGPAGTGWGGGGPGNGTIETGVIGTHGHGDNNDRFGDSTGHRIRERNPHGPMLRPGPIVSEGAIAPEAIRRVVLRNLGQIQHCHEQGLSMNPNLEGRVVVRFIIGGDGSVMGSTINESTISIPSVGQCMANAVRRWQFPIPEGGGIVTVNYPFNLQHPE